MSFKQEARGLLRHFSEARGVLHQFSDKSLRRLSSVANLFKRGEKGEAFPVVEVTTMNVLTPMTHSQGIATTHAEKQEKFAKDLVADVKGTFERNIINFLVDAGGFGEVTSETAREKAREFAKAEPDKVLPMLNNHGDKELTRQLVGNPVDSLQGSINQYRNAANKIGVSPQEQDKTVKNACDQFMQTAVAYGLGDAIKEEMSLRQRGSYIGSTKNVKRAEDLSKSDWRTAEESLAEAKAGPWQKASHSRAANENQQHKPLQEILSNEERQHMRQSMGAHRSTIATGTHGLPMQAQGRGKEGGCSR